MPHFVPWDSKPLALMGKLLALPGAQLEVLTGTGHMPNYEAADQFNALVGCFLA